MARTYPFSEPVDLEVDPTYAVLQREEPVSRVSLPYGGDAWLVTSHAGVRMVLSDPRFSRAAAAGRDVPRIAPFVALPGLMTNMDAPEHTRIRKLVSGAFTMRRINALAPRIEQISHDLLDVMEPPADLMTGFAIPLPTIVIGEMMGVPAADQVQLREWTDRMVRVTPIPEEEIASAAAELAGYLGALLAQRRKQQADDVMSALLTARDEQGRLSEQELVLLVFFILTASYDTTTKSFANSVFLLLDQFPDKWAELHADPDLIPTAVEELLRYIPLVSVGSNTRIAVEDVEVDGVTIPAGDAVIISTTAANRDPKMFERPDELDFTRKENRHLAFSHGLHHCLGAQLSRVMLQIALATLVKRCPDLRLAGPVAFKTGRLLRGPESLPVTW